MDLTPYVDNLRHELALAAEAGGEEARALAERLTATLESSVRLTLFEALSAAADEITRDLAPGSVDVRLRGRDLAFVVDTPAQPEAPAEPEPEPVDVEDGAATARINLRLSDALKARVEEAAAGERLSANAWIVRATAAALARAERPAGQRTGGKRFTGWVR
ncbi:toxin-antitoxin system HicB family antitoxin [Actinosynnema sp. NPDC020468]|uniref:toxin-antitoxin system HicB family antitoxin n=1 Tax=Actinosynnema sp. NPDC020468 TaxID=3154488 RepID=UPI0033EAD19D